MFGTYCESCAANIANAGIMNSEVNHDLRQELNLSAQQYVPLLVALLLS